MTVTAEQHERLREYRRELWLAEEEQERAAVEHLVESLGFGWRLLRYEPRLVAVRETEYRNRRQFASASAGDLKTLEQRIRKGGG